MNNGITDTRKMPTRVTDYSQIVVHGDQTISAVRLDSSCYRSEISLTSYKRMLKQIVFHPKQNIIVIL